MVSLLLHEGAEPNAANKKGKTALMMAALWGRIGSVKVLLNKNADKDMQDRKRNAAINLAKPSRKNAKERSNRSRENAGNNVVRDANRREIVYLLAGSMPKQHYDYAPPLSKRDIERCFFWKSPSLASFYMITFQGPHNPGPFPVPVSDLHRTLAVLERGKQFQQIYAISGWGSDTLPQDSKDRPTWVNQVITIAAAVGHELPGATSEVQDCGRPGKYMACHAEKKLIAFFIEKHLFTRQDREHDLQLEASLCDAEHTFSVHEHLHNMGPTNPDPRRLRNLATASLEEDVIRMRDRVRSHQALMKLSCLSSNKMPPFSLRNAVILTSNPICPDCNAFLGKVNEHFDLKIEMACCPCN
jgi:hypothetical protein